MCFITVNSSVSSIRLVDGLDTVNSTSGRLEVYYNHQWGTVCDDRWDVREAIVVCRMLGYSKGIARTRAAFGRGTGQIWLDSVDCTGEEKTIFDCKHIYWGHAQTTCSHLEDAAVICSTDGRPPLLSTTLLY